MPTDEQLILDLNLDVHEPVHAFLVGSIDF